MMLISWLMLRCFNMDFVVDSYYDLMASDFLDESEIEALLNAPISSDDKPFLPVSGEVF